jgi:multidrug efflux pump
VNAAIRSQNAQVSSGTIGELPNIVGQTISSHRGGERAAEQSWSSLATSCCAPMPTAPPCACATWRASNWARRLCHLARLNGKPATGIGVQLSPSGNALAAAKAVRERMAELQILSRKG